MSDYTNLTSRWAFYGGVRKSFSKSVIQRAGILVVFLLLNSALLKGQSWPTTYTIQQSFTCIGCGVNLPGNAMGNATTDYATISVPLGIISSISFDMVFPGNQPAGSILSLWVESPSGSLDILTGVSYQLMNNAANVANTGWTSIDVGNTSQKILYTSSMQPFNKVRITITGVLSVAKVLNVYSVFSGTMPLPVRFSSFKGKQIESQIELTWITEFEHTSDYFEVQRSTDAKKWVSVAKIKSKGESQSLVVYQYTDAQPQAEINYYRLRQVDLDNKEAYSRIIAVTYLTSHRNETQVSEVAAYPNPARANQEVRIKWIGGTVNSAESATVSGTMYDFLGKAWKCTRIIFDQDGYAVHLPEGLPSGVYTILLKTDESVASCKIYVE